MLARVVYVYHLDVQVYVLKFIKITWSTCKVVNEFPNQRYILVYMALHGHRKCAKL
jgi:phage-related protein